MAKMIKDQGYEMVEMSQFCPGANYAIFKKPGNQNPAVYKISEITLD
jgi:predicted Fe-Mo cluster-binding NifX family protein